MKTAFDKKKDHVRYGTSNNRELYFQDGNLFDEQGNQLPHDLDLVQRRGYQITNEIRDQFVKQALMLEKQQKIAQLEAELEVRKQEMEKDWSRQVSQMNDELIAADTPAAPVMPDSVEIPDLVLTPLEVLSAQSLAAASASHVAIITPPQPVRTSRVRPGRTKAATT